MSVRCINLGKLMIITVNDQTEVLNDGDMTRLWCDTVALLNIEFYGPAFVRFGTSILATSFEDWIQLYQFADRFIEQNFFNELNEG